MTRPPAQGLVHRFPRLVIPRSFGPTEENYILLACLRRALNPEMSGAEPEWPSGEICWPRFLALAQQHEVLPLLAPGLTDRVSWVPRNVREWLNERLKCIVARNLALASELLELHKLFQTFGIPAVPFKGPSLAVALYGSLSLRQIGDLDIFVDRENVDRALRLLVANGYSISERFHKMPTEELYFRHKDVQLTHRISHAHIELHWSACEPEFDRRLSNRTLWHPDSSTVLLGVSVPIPAREELLVLLSLHGLRHRWDCLKWICDLGALITSSPDLDWDAVLGKADRLARKRMVLLALTLVQDLFAISVPSQISGLIERDPMMRRMARSICTRHLQPRPGREPASCGDAVLNRSHFDFLRVQTRDRLADRLSLFARLVVERVAPSAEDRRCFPLPNFLCPFYWLIRPLRLCRTYGPVLLFQEAARLLGVLCGSG